MDGPSNAANAILAFEEGLPADPRSRLHQVLGDLESSSAIPEGLELTLAVALLDHAIAEVRRCIAT